MTEGMKTKKLSKTQTTTLTYVQAHGGVVNGYAGQKGVDLRAVGALLRKGFLVRVSDCAGCVAHWSTGEGECTSPLPTGEHGCYSRVKITAAGISEIS